MNDFFKPLIYLVLYLLFTGSVDAFPQPEFQLDHIEKTSDLIALVKVFETQKFGTEKLTIGENDYSCPSVRSTCKILSILKDNVTTTNEFIDVIFWDCSELLISAENLVAGEISIVFLKEHGEDLFVLSNYKQSKVPIASFDKDCPATLGTLRDRIGSLLISDIEKQTPEQIVRTFQWIKNIKYDVSQDILNPLLKNTNIQIRAVVLEQLVRGNEKDAIQKSVNLLSENRPITYELASLAWSLEGAGISTKQSNQLAESKNSAISKAGMRLLRTKADVSSISFLVKQLDNTDAEIQYNALVALYHIARETGPSLNDFRLDPKLKIEECKSMLNKKVILKHTD